MNVRDFFKFAPAARGLSFSGDPNASFAGFHTPGMKDFRDDQFYVILDGSWSRNHISGAKQWRQTIDQIFKSLDRSGVQNVIAPSSLEGVAGLRGRNVIYVNRSFDFIINSGLAARAAAAEAQKPIVAVTGAVGKSSTTAMMSHAIRSAYPERSVLHPGTTHNILVRAMAEMSSIMAHDAGVFELSGIVFSDLRKREKAASPDAAVLTNIAEAHLERMGSLESIAHQKSGIFDSPPDGGTAVFGLDTSHSDILERAAHAADWDHIYSFGESERSDFRLLNYDPATRTATVSTPGGHYEYVLGAEGKHMALNSLSTLAALWNIYPEGIDRIIESFGTFEALPGRGGKFRVQVGEGPVEVVDDTATANPASMGAFLKSVDDSSLPEGCTRKVVVLGDMLQLGDEGPKFHRALTSVLADSSIDKVVLHGPLMHELYEEIADDERFSWFDTLDEVTGHLKTTIRAGDAVSFKSGKLMKLSKVVKDLREFWG